MRSSKNIAPALASLMSSRNLLYLLFAVSGLSGLLYESVWSHYLKLFLGHAAYAQTLVLAIFMGGMAVGAWVASRFGTRWKNLLVKYALVEGLIGVSAVVFHKLFVGVTDIAYDDIIPILGSPWVVDAVKWSLAAALILPQSILLGMTFPLMSTAVMRRYPGGPGANLAMLYFTNSMGAAIGVLASGFVLIEAVGLPGTVLTAGLINIVVALVAWWLAKQRTELTKVSYKTTRSEQSTSWSLMIATSFLTGAASFIYEIGWIRMLSLVLGTSTRAFELMLSAFILGLAFGGLWIRNRIDRLTQPVKTLAIIQLVMGLLALGTLTAYNASFEMMHGLMHMLSPTDGAYFLFNLASHGIAFLIMVPVTFCAGMTLPLITHELLRSGHGEKSIGAVYAANTLGAIVGVFFAVHIGMSTLGLKGLIGAGSVVDMALGVALLGYLAKRSNYRATAAASVLAVVVLLMVTVGVEFDRYKMASGVYRHGHFLSPKNAEILYHRDGKTATVDLLKHADGTVNISTNGKSDAVINMVAGGSPSSDEYTMTLAAALPLLTHPYARTAANIGMGSGLSTHVLLSSRTLERVDTIEIEPAMIEAARGFRPHVNAAFDDQRSRFFIDDAKTFFAAHRSRYDIIVSEPSNPWVSGVAGLFTDEFYHRMRRHLNPRGVFVQWLQVYEIDFSLVASVMKAIGRNFSDYVLYASNNGDLIILAVADGELPAIGGHVFSQPELTRALNRLHIHTPQDLILRRIGDRTVLEPLFAYAPIPVNSDFFPILDLQAVRARFLKHNAFEIAELRTNVIPALDMLGSQNAVTINNRPTPTAHFAVSWQAYYATVLRDFYRIGVMPAGQTLDPMLLRHALLTIRPPNQCRERSTAELWLDSADQIMRIVIPYLPASDSIAVWQRLRASDCYGRLNTTERNVFILFGALARRDAPGMTALATELLDDWNIPHQRNSYLLSVGMLGYLADRKPKEALQMWNTYAERALGPTAPDILLRLLWAHSISATINRANH